MGRIILLMNPANRFFPCMTLIALRPSEMQETPLVGGFGCLELCLYGIRELAISELE